MHCYRYFYRPTVCDCSGWPWRYGYFPVCWSTGVYLIWKINGGVLAESAQNDGLFVVQRESNMGIWQSNLTVLITSAENNGTIVQCVLLASGLPDVSSDIATLTVLPGSYSLCASMTESEVDHVFTLFLCRCW